MERWSQKVALSKRANQEGASTRRINKAHQEGASNGERANDERPSSSSMNRLFCRQQSLSSWDYGGGFSERRWVST